MLSQQEVRLQLKEMDRNLRLQSGLAVTSLLDALYEEYLAQVDYLEKQGFTNGAHYKNYRIKKKLMKKLSKWTAKARHIELNG